MGNVLFFTPVLPYPTGHGSAMRASVALEILAERHAVTVIHPAQWLRRTGADEDWARRHSAAFFHTPAQLSPATISQLEPHLSSTRFDAAYVFRLSAAAPALQVLAARNSPPPPALLDLDDDEYDRALRLQALPGGAASGVSPADLQRFAMYYKVFLPRFAVKLFAKAEDCSRFASQFPGHRFVHLPNVVRPATVAHTQPDPNRLLFLGTMDYPPNVDAVLHFSESILPLLRGEDERPKLRVVGDGAPAPVRALAQAHTGIDIAGPVPDVAPEYGAAAMLVVPLRAGGGTRIKILEAFSYRTPVVSTTLGAEGLGVTGGEQLLIADTPEQFAAACTRLLRDPALRARLTANAFEWLNRTHSMDHARAVLHRVCP